MMGVAKIVCGDTQLLGGKPHICTSEPGHRSNLHICCCGTVWPVPQNRPPAVEDDLQRKPN